MSTKPTPQEARALLQEATQAAIAGNAPAVLEALFASGYPDGLIHRLRKHWAGKLPEYEFEICVGRAVDAAYANVAQGHHVRDLGAWLWKAVQNIASKRWDDEHRLRSDLDEAVAAEPESPTERKQADDLQVYRRAEALRIARKLLPRIGTGQIINVMEMVIEAAENGILDMPPAEIADALGLSEDSVRKLISRGLQRLAREAEADGVEFPMELPDSYNDIAAEG